MRAFSTSQENGAKFEMILTQQQVLTDIETKQTADGYALKQVNDQLAAEMVASMSKRSRATSGCDDHPRPLMPALDAGPWCVDRCSRDYGLPTKARSSSAAR